MFVKQLLIFKRYAFKIIHSFSTIELHKSFDNPKKEQTKFNNDYPKLSSHFLLNKCSKSS